MQPGQKINSRTEVAHRSESDVDVDVIDYGADDSDAESINSVEHNRSPVPAADNDLTHIQPSAASEQASSDDEPKSPVKAIEKKPQGFERENRPSQPTHEEVRTRRCAWKAGVGSLQRTR